MNADKKLAIIRKQAEITKAALGEMTFQLPAEAEAVRIRANLAVDAILAISAQMDERSAEAS